MRKISHHKGNNYFPRIKKRVHLGTFQIVAVRNDGAVSRQCFICLFVRPYRFHFRARGGISPVHGRVWSGKWL